MKFSVLLPTRNRLELLKYAIASVLQQDEEDFEIIISDNYSEENIGEYIQSLNNPKIKYFRTSSFLSVTENWNNALDKSSGEWIVMLGDDDCLMKGYFSTIRQLLEQFPNPDFIYNDGFLFAYPHVLPQHPQGLVQTFGSAQFLLDKDKPYWLPEEKALKLAKKTFNFQCFFAFNMQFSIIHRPFMEKLQIDGKFFHSPYPDYYATTILMLFGKRILACPYPLVGVGISPKSFGYYYFNKREIEGLDFFNNSNEKASIAEFEHIVLPGTDMNTNWLLSLEAIKSNFKKSGFSINYRRYRLLQIIESLHLFFTKPKDYKSHFRLFWKKMRFSEKCLYGVPWYVLSYFPLIFRTKYIGLLWKFAKSHFFFPGEPINQRFENIQQFFEKIDPKNLSG